MVHNLPHLSDAYPWRRCNTFFIYHTFLMYIRDASVTRLQIIYIYIYFFFWYFFFWSQHTTQRYFSTHSPPWLVPLVNHIFCFPHWIMNNSTIPTGGLSLRSLRSITLACNSWGYLHWRRGMSHLKGNWTTLRAYKTKRTRSGGSFCVLGRLPFDNVITKNLKLCLVSWFVTFLLRKVRGTNV